MWRKGEPSYTLDGNVNWYNHCGEQYGGSLKKLKIELPHQSSLGIYQDKTIIQFTPVFTAALFTIAKTWKQPRCPLINKEDVVHIYNGLLLSYKQDEIMPFAATWMHLEMITPCEVSQRQTSYGIAYM